ncbi:PE family protein [Mycobacterium spongiae]|uniref:PE-PPE domain-containing protein n=1 Tax=Mycobacterium spongiae TaxID=886343 RepID=A0A975JUF8_9MYCO|nr:PE-PPE domain-containing protein [Mycobacterium spongiae]QUR65904.1 PE-PPE domain-containing protein [Mycobacterium spongiae]
MTNLVAGIESMVVAAEEVAGIGSILNQANGAAAGPTTAVAAAAADEVSAAAATLFSAHGQEYQAITRQMAGFHDQFARTLAAAGRAYADAEAANAAAASRAVSVLTASAPALLSPLNVVSGFNRALSGGTLTAPAAAATDVTLVMGGSGLPIPPLTYVNDLVTKYVTPNFPDFIAAHARALFTPEGLYPLTGIKDLTLTESVARGVTILNSAIAEQLAAGNDVHVVGYSQSAIIASLQMQNLAAMGSPNTANLSFTLLGNLMNPNGGLMSRFAGLSLPGIGLDFYGATPADTGYPTDVYTLQYDGYASFPQYPINVLSVLNAFAGIQFVHGIYPDLDPSNLPPGYNLVQLPTSPGYSGGTDYFMITHPGLPLLDPVRAIPVIGNAVADLVQPNLTYLVNLGYGDPNYGYSTGYADVATPFGVLPPIPATIGIDLLSGAQQGIGDFATTITTEVAPSVSGFPNSLLGSGGTDGSGSSLPDTPISAPAPGFSPIGFIDAVQALNTDVTRSITNAVASTSAALLATADIVNEVVTTLPSYNLNLFLDGIKQVLNGDATGGLIYAFGAPLAASTAMLTLAAGFQLGVVVDAVGSIV